MGSFRRKAVTGALLSITLYFTRSYFGGGVCKSQARIDGKVVVITGANTGIGKDTALELVRRGGRVYMACRSLERGHKAAEDIRRELRLGYVDYPREAKDPEIHVMKLDLDSLKSVRQFVEEFKTREERLDILINNAGVMWTPYGKTKDGFEQQIGVNHFGHFLLTNLLLDTIKAAAPSRIVTVSSLAHTRGKIKFDDIMSEKEYKRQAAYEQSKLANVLFSRELAKRLQGSGVNTYVLHPGVVRTDLARNIDFMQYPGIAQFLQLVTWPFIKSSWEGAQTTICCAVDEEIGSQTGLYYSDCAEKEVAPQAQSEEDAQKLWTISEDLVGLKTAENTS